MEFEPIRELTALLEAEDFSVIADEEVDDWTAVVARRAQWAMTARLHIFVIIFNAQACGVASIERASDAALNYEIKHKGGLPRGLQTGTFTFATFVCHGLDPEVQDWVSRERTHRYAAMQLPLVADLDSQQLLSYSGRLSRGGLFQPLVDKSRGQIAAGLGCKVL